MENLLRKNNIIFHEKERKIKSIIKELSNHKCIDCNKQNPEYISLNNAVFICQTCFRKHQKFPLSISNLLKNNLSSLTLKELQYLYFGGNKKMLEFMKYEYPKLIKLSPSFVYKTIAMEYYRNWLKYIIEGGIKPTKPKEEIAYKSVEDRDIITNNNLEKNKDNNVITIDFYNDCYKYNDKYNRTITGFINNKEINIIQDEKDKNNIQDILDKNLKNSSNIRNYFKIINKNNSNKNINTKNVNFFSLTQSNFLPPNKLEHQTKYTTNYQQNFNSNIIINIKEGTKSQKNLIHKENQNDIIDPSKRDKKIYIRPKYDFLKNTLENENEKNEKRNNLNLIKVKCTKDSKYSRHNIINSERLDKFMLNKINNDINEMNENNELTDMGGGKSSKLLKNVNDINNKKEINLYINDRIINSNNEKNISQNKIIFKKKNLKNYFYIKNHQKYVEDELTSKTSDFDVIQKSNNINTQIKTDYCTSNNEDSITSNTIRSYSTNKSMKHFYKRNPRKINSSKPNKRKSKKIKEEKIDEKINLIKLKKEKSEILQSLKVLMKKKMELEENSKNENKKKEIKMI